MPSKPESGFNRFIALGIWMVTAALIVVGVAFASTGSASVNDDAFGIAPIVLAFATTGLVLALRVPGNRMGWLYLLSGVLGGIYVASYLYAGIALVQGDLLAAHAAVVSTAVYFPWILSMISLPVLLFPDGFPPSQGWVWLQTLIVGLAVVTFAARMVAMGPIPGHEQLASPFAVEPIDRVLRSWPIMAILTAALLVSLLGPPIALVHRFRRSDGLQRQQLRWLAFAAVFAATGLALTYTVGELTDSPLVSVATAIGLLGLLGIPVATGIAVTRYRLYDLDRLVNRTIVYGALVTVLAALYATAVSLGAALLNPSNSNLAIAASVLATAAAVNPLRRRIQSFVDRRFFRKPYDAQHVNESLNSKLRDQVDPNGVTSDWIDVVTSTLQPTSVAVWTRNQHE